MSELAVDRVVVRLDAVSDNGASIETAAGLAARWHVKLHGLFIEDEELLRLAELPFARQIGLAAGPAKAIERSGLEDELRLAARHARRLLADAATQLRIEWSFRTVRRAIGAPFDDTGAGDFIVIQADCRPFAHHVRLSSTRRGAPPDLGRPTLLLRQRAQVGKRRVIALIGSGLTRRIPNVLSAAAELAACRAETLTILCNPGDLSTGGVETWLKETTPSSVPIRVEPSPATVEALRRRIVALDCGALVFEPAALLDRIALLDVVAPWDLLLVP
ncbi:MAG: hypothetical protein HY060_17070 [Proteobacteria bacterium]|nr:hypothetical protein [Pseudomonadota bacterium]